MAKKFEEYLIDTDVIESHLLDGKNSYLELLLQKGICFTTVLNASDLLYRVNGSNEATIITDVLSSLKILGIHSRYSLLVPKYSKQIKNFNEALFCVVADYNKLPIVTLKKSRYIKSGLLIYHPKEIIS